MKTIGIFSLLAGIALVAACGGNDSYDSSKDAPEVQEARASFPTALQLHEKVIARSCSPTNGVCHNAKEYPDMHTVGNFVSVASKPCNEDKVNDPMTIYDGCEPLADEIELPSLGFRTRIGYMGADQYDESGVYREITTEHTVPESGSFLAAKFLRNGAVIASLDANIRTTGGTKLVRLENYYNVDYQTYLALQTLAGGDPNQNGVFGYTNGWHEITPGRPDRSYLIGRITGTVPGTRMPLANQALSDAEYVAIECWIESIGSTPSPNQAIDYDGCRYAKHPQHFAIGN